MVENGRVAFRAVTPGIMGDTDVEVASGASEGETIVAGSYKTLRTLKDKARIKIEEPHRDSWWKQ